MAIKDLVVHIDNSQACEKRLQAAIQLAQRHEAHLTGLYVMRPLADFMMYPVEPVSGHVRDVIQKPLLEAKDKARGMFEAATDRAGLAAEWREAEGAAAKVLNLSARHADLVVLGQYNPADQADHSEGLAGRILLGSGRPCLVVPYIGVQKTLGKRVLVAWDGSREAARAVNDALPVLQDANIVSILAVDPPHRDDAIPCADVSLHLARHGVKAEAMSRTASDIDAGTLFLSHAVDLDTDLLVMGAYGHSRLSEMMMGGATKTILNQMTVPVLMSH